MQTKDRSDSYDSIPELDFIKDMLKDELITSNQVSEYRRKELNGELLPEPLLVTDKSRFVLFPIKHTDVSEPDSLIL